MEWIISFSINLAILVIWMIVRSCYKKEDRLVYLNAYEFIETLKEPARSYYLKHSLRMLDQLFLECLLAPWLGSIVKQFGSQPLLIIVLVLYTIAIIVYAVYQEMNIQKQTKAM